MPWSPWVLILGGFLLSLAEANIAPGVSALVYADTFKFSNSEAIHTPGGFSYSARQPDSCREFHSDSEHELPPGLPASPRRQPIVHHRLDGCLIMSRLETHSQESQQRYHTGVAELQQANCLQAAELMPGSVIYVPPLPTQTPLPCGRPYGWIVYIIRPGDTLYHLSQAYGVSVASLQTANCMGSSTLLHVGDKLYVPPWATRTPSPTFPAPVIYHCHTDRYSGNRHAY